MPKEIFYSYSHKDEELRNEINQHLSMLQRNGLIVGWHDRQIGAGDRWRDEIDSHVHSADIILLLISSDFLASDYCYGIEMKIALERHAKREAIVIPIILRPVDWSGAPFAHLQALPRDAKPLTTWPNRDEALAGIAKSLREVVVSSHATGMESSVPLVAHADLPKPRILDAAIPRRVVQGESTELLVLIRLPQSKGLSGILIEEDFSDATPEDVKSRPFSIGFPVGLDGRPGPLKVTVKVTSPDFSPAEQSKNLFVPVDADSEVCPFMLTPVRTGQLRVLVELQWEDALRGHRRLLTDCVAEGTVGRMINIMSVVRCPVGIESGVALLDHVPGGKSVTGALAPPRVSLGGTGVSYDSERLPKPLNAPPNFPLHPRPVEAAPPAARPQANWMGIEDAPRPPVPFAAELKIARSKSKRIVGLVGAILLVLSGSFLYFAQRPPDPTGSTQTPITRPTHEPMSVSPEIMAGKKISGSNPAYPASARKRHIEGTVALRATISRTGAVESLIILSGPKSLQTAALQAAKDWRYEPYLFEGEPIEVETTINVNFKIGS
jgi:TonB family protein